MKKVNILLFFLFCSCIAWTQKVGVGTTTPAAKFDVRGTPNTPTIPGVSSTGIIRIGLGPADGIDIGKMGYAPFAAWMQAGYDNSVADPISLQPIGGNVGIGTLGAISKLDVRGAAGNPSIPGPVSTGIIRLGIGATEGIDIGKMGIPPYAGWIQSGINGNTADPLSLQPAGGNVSIGTQSPDPSAALDISSATQGFLPPRMSFADRMNIISPAEGLVIWCNNCGVYGQLQVYNGFMWTNMLGSPAKNLPIVGDDDGGGKVAYILQTGDPGYVSGEIHGLIAAPTDQSYGTVWGCLGVDMPGAQGIAIGTGNQNTIDIMNGCATPDIPAKLCGDLVLGGFNDWYMPSKNELNRLYVNRVAIGGFSLVGYWSSTEDPVSSANFACSQDFFGDGSQHFSSKSFTYSVRAIRSF